MVSKFCVQTEGPGVPNDLPAPKKKYGQPAPKVPEADFKAFLGVKPFLVLNLHVSRNLCVVVVITQSSVR